MGPSFVPSIFTSARKILRGSDPQIRFASWVMALGALTEKRKLSGTDSTHFFQVEGRWER